MANAGFTTALTAPKTGIFPGQGAVINLAGDRAGDLVVASPVTLQVNLQPPGGFGGFPGSLMGVVAYVRQVYLDVQHDVDARKQYDASPRGVERPEYDRTLRAVAEAQAANRPVLMPATSEAQIARILDFAQELKLRPVLVRRARRLQAGGGRSARGEEDARDRQPEVAGARHQRAIPTPKNRCASCACATRRRPRPPRCRRPA